MSINDFKLENLDKENLILTIASTTGNGDSPTNGNVRLLELIFLKNLIVILFRNKDYRRIYEQTKKE